MVGRDASIDRDIRDALHFAPSIQIAILFGSLATGEGTSGSDVDMAVGFGRLMTMSERTVLIQELAVRTGRPVGILFRIPKTRIPVFRICPSSGSPAV
jgi:predicted nucleotidyltransferase